MVDDATRTSILAKLTAAEREDVERYIAIYVDQGFTRLREVNSWIDRHDAWDDFPAIASLNDHGYPSEVPGIWKRIYGPVCQILQIEPDFGRPLLGSRARE